MKHSELTLFKENSEKITCLTAYDASMAKLLDQSGIDAILIGDSLGMVIQGGENTRSVSIDDMIYHTSFVSSSCNDALIIADMPFASYDNPKDALNNARALIDVGARMVKIEGGSEHSEVIKTLISNNINICGHLGLQPQMVVNSDEYRVQGRDENSAKKIIKNAVLLESLGVRMERHCENALALAKYLKNHDRVEWVNYAALPDDKYHDVCKKITGGQASGIISFGIKGGKDAGAKFIDALQMILRLVNIGDAKSLACHPASTTHRQLSPEELALAGVSEDMIRISVGIEHIDDIIQDVEQAIEASKK